MTTRSASAEINAFARVRPHGHQQHGHQSYGDGLQPHSLVMELAESGARDEVIHEHCRAGLALCFPLTSMC